MKNCLIIDTETQGLDPLTHQAIEVAAILYSVEHGVVLRSVSNLIRSQGGNAAECINRIPAAVVAEATDADTAWEPVFSLAEKAGVICAHNAEFDRGFVPIALRDCLPWVCTKEDIVWPKQTKPGMSLVALALAHDLGVAYAHRAMADCDLIARLLTRSKELGADLQALIAHGMRPKATFAALVSYNDRAEASGAGFHWECAVKRWERTMAIEDAAALPFSTRQVTP